ncbi:hypothetical protein OE88DRAFT_1641913 [Heliocybe sulcata]|uniref:Uncharacterized protein n=1 Tax=Heliocybe sulcata TaxID=5364 RepID=A0A5C3NH55_9AGAM|nr:hypothetical protein OE88DRAFT_1641913 [Heliocybe sulcata]
MSNPATPTNAPMDLAIPSEFPTPAEARQVPSSSPPPSRPSTPSPAPRKGGDMTTIILGSLPIMPKHRATVNAGPPNNGNATGKGKARARNTPSPLPPSSPTTTVLPLTGYTGPDPGSPPSSPSRAPLALSTSTMKDVASMDTTADGNTMPTPDLLTASDRHANSIPINGGHTAAVGATYTQDGALREGTPTTLPIPSTPMPLHRRKRHCPDLHEDDGHLAGPSGSAPLPTTGRPSEQDAPRPPRGNRRLATPALAMPPNLAPGAGAAAPPPLAPPPGHPLAANPPQPAEGLQMMAKPVTGWPVRLQANPWSLLINMSDSQVTTWQQLPGESVLAELYGEDTPTPRTSMRQATQIKAITGAVLSVDPTTFSISPPIPQKDRLLNQEVAATQDGTVFFTPFGLYMPDRILIGHVMGWVEEDRHILRNYLDSLYKQPATAQRIIHFASQDEANFHTNPAVLLIQFGASIRVEILDTQPSKAAMITIRPLTGSPEHRYELVDHLRSLSYSHDRFGPGTLVDPPFLCKKCHLAGHPSGMCVYPSLTGWPGVKTQMTANRNNAHPAHQAIPAAVATPANAFPALPAALQDAIAPSPNEGRGGAQGAGNRGGKGQRGRGRGKWGRGESSTATGSRGTSRSAVNFVAEDRSGQAPDSLASSATHPDSSLCTTSSVPDYTQSGPPHPPVGDDALQGQGTSLPPDSEGPGDLPRIPHREWR